MKQLFAILLTLLVSVSAQGAHAYNVNQHNCLDRLTTAELMLRGQDFLQNKGWADSAIVCYSIVAGRAQRKDLDSKEMYHIAKALNNIGYIYAAYYYDYQKAYEAHQEWHALNDSIQNANVRMQMSSRMLPYEHDKQLLEQQRTIDNERMKVRLAWAFCAVALLAIGLLSVLIWLWRKRQKMHDMEVRQQIVGMRMENTRNRITPHFIYNALTSIAMLCQLDPDKAQEATITFADYLRGNMDVHLIRPAIVFRAADPVQVLFTCKGADFR